MKVLGNRALLAQLPRDTAQGGILLAERYLEEQRLHRVVALGTKVKEDGLSIGDIVLVDQYSLQSRTPAGDNLWIIDVKDLALAVGK